MTDNPQPRFNALFGEAQLLDDGHVQFTHECRNGTETTVLPSPPWKVTNTEPLTVEPSVHCTECGWHGWIHGGVARQVHVSEMPARVEHPAEEATP